MPPQDSGAESSDSDEAGDAQLTRNTRRISIDLPHLQVQAQAQLRIAEYLTSHAPLTIVNVYKPKQYICGPGTGTQGFHAMCKSFISAKSSKWKKTRSDDSSHLQRRQSRYHSPSYELTGLLSAQNKHDRLPNGYGQESSASDTTHAEAPGDYEEQDLDWFKEGRYFSIWAPHDREIHTRKFILLHSLNKEGQGVLVESLDSDRLRRLSAASSAWWTTVVLKSSETSGDRSRSNSPSKARAVQPQSQQEHAKDKDRDVLLSIDKKLTAVHMDEHADQNVLPGTFIRLEHTYNIPFGYKCIDLGMLGEESLRDLRSHYIKYRVQSWGLTSWARKHFGKANS